MNTFTKYARLVSVGIVFSVALPVYAEDESVAPNKIYPSAKPMVAKSWESGRSSVYSPTSETSLRQDDTEATKRNAEAPDPSTTPYVTYEGATSSNTDR